MNPLSKPLCRRVADETLQYGDQTVTPFEDLWHEGLARLRYRVFAALRRHERLCGDAVGGLQLGLSNDQRAVRGGRSDQTVMGLAGHRLHLACDRLRMGQVGIGS